MWAHKLKDKFSVHTVVQYEKSINVALDWVNSFINGTLRGLWSLMEYIEAKTGSLDLPDDTWWHLGTGRLNYGAYADLRDKNWLLWPIQVDEILDTCHFVGALRVVGWDFDTWTPSDCIFGARYQHSYVEYYISYILGYSSRLVRVINSCCSCR